MTVDELLRHPILDLPHNWRDTQEPSYYHYIIGVLSENGKYSTLSYDSLLVTSKLVQSETAV